ncbi:MAG: tripartite tricarboxylate transporter substrate binding protein [Ectothiorhodospiraceae bacterium]|nr:tripartite tricarboxylate transporter substrate binding protein [Chromatiales bacterium]MCP5156409.1 tripartite tricarboxylate transporter substrate binding protein [Ectothiorhodospiraceae bacterium]
MTNITRRRLLAGSAGALGAMMLPFGASRAAGYPERPITVAMTSPAGGATDRGLRPLSTRLKTIMDAPAIALQDMSGAGGVQAVEYVMSQPADGYTWVGMNDTVEVFAMMDRYPYTWKDFDFWMSGGTACGITVKSDSKIKTFDEWMDWVGSNPGKLSCSTTPSGSLWANVAVYLNKQAALDFKVVYYKGGGPSVRAVVSGEVDFGCMGVTPMANFMRAGQLRCLAATTPGEWETAGTVIPSMTNWIKEKTFVKTMPWTNIHGIALRKGTPEDVLAKIDDAFAKVMADPSMEKVYQDNAFFKFQVGRDKANDLMRQRTELQAYIAEKIVGNAKRTRDELGIGKLEEG